MLLFTGAKQRTFIDIRQMPINYEVTPTSFVEATVKTRQIRPGQI